MGTLKRFTASVIQIKVDIMLIIMVTFAIKVYVVMVMYTVSVISVLVDTDEVANSIHNIIALEIK